MKLSMWRSNIIKLWEIASTSCRIIICVRVRLSFAGATPKNNISFFSTCTSVITKLVWLDVWQRVYAFHCYFSTVSYSFFEYSVLCYNNLCTLYTYGKRQRWISFDIWQCHTILQCNFFYAVPVPFIIFFFGYHRLLKVHVNNASSTTYVTRIPQRKKTKNKKTDHEIELFSILKRNVWNIHNTKGTNNIHNSIICSTAKK